MSSAAKTSPGLGAADQYEIDQMAGDELLKLQRQSRAMENERLVFIEDKRKKQRKTAKITEILQKEKSQLQLQLEIIQESKSSKRESELETNAQNLYEEIDASQKLLDSEKSTLWELEGHIKKIEKEINTLRGNEVTDMRYKETICKTQKDVVKLENRLDVANKRAGVVMAENSELRQIIDHMLTERSSFNDMWQKMVKELNQGKKYTMELIEQSTAAYDQREELCNKLQALKDRGQADKMIHIQEMRELQRKLDHDAKLQHFFEIKGHHRPNTELEAREAMKKKMAQDEYDNQLKEYQDIISKIQMFSNEPVMDRLGAQFNKQEEENFALFNYVNELSSEVEILNECVKLLEDNIDEQRNLNISREKSQMDTIASLQLQMEQQTQMTTAAHELKLVNEENLQLLQHGVEKIFRMIRCEDAPVLNLLGSHKRISINNVNLFIGIIERRANQIITAMSTADQPSRILGKKDRIPKFNVRESAKKKTGSAH